MKTRFLAPLFAATAIAFALPAHAADNAQDFVTKAANGGMLEVESSKAVQSKLEDQATKDFAQKMIDDHGAANEKLKAVAEQQKLTVPTELDAEHKADLDALQNTSPADQPYVKLQRDAHTEAVALFESYAKDGDNAQLKTFAQQTLPTLKMHQAMIEKIAAGKDETSSTSNSTTPAVATTDTVNPAAPVPGANSFTEDQAKTRIEKAGFTGVSALTKDDQGIWRGQATKDGKETAVALDYQGNVVAGN